MKQQEHKQTTMTNAENQTMNREHWTIPNHEEVQGWTRSQHKRGENIKVQANKTYYKFYSPNGKMFRSVKSVVKHIEQEKLKANRIIACVECSNVTIEQTPGGGIHIRWTEKRAKKTKEPTVEVQEPTVEVQEPTVQSKSKKAGAITDEEKAKFRNVWEKNLPIKWMVNSNPKRGKSKERFEKYWNNGQNNLEEAKKSGLKWQDALNDYKRKIIVIDE
tara:strand:+ start:371 stop:1024 length:654 start_codon:yes stop_codon:yes gene_type:complete